jgi:hypothetical protein
MPPLAAPPRDGAGARGGTDGLGWADGRAGSGERLAATGGPWSDEGDSGATAREAGLRRPAPPRVPRRVRGRGDSPSVSRTAVGSGATSASGAGSAVDVGAASDAAAAARARERPAPPRVPRRDRGRGASVAPSSVAAGGASAGGVSGVASASAEAAVVLRVRPPRRLGFSSAAESSDGSLADAASPPCRDRFRKDSHSEITQSPQGSFVRCSVQRSSQRWP